MKDISKKAFLLPKSLISTTDEMSNEDAGLFLKAILCYQNQTETPELPESLKLLFKFVVSQFERDNEEYSKTCEKRRQNAKKRWEKKQEEKEEEPFETPFLDTFPKEEAEFLRQRDKEGKIDLKAFERSATGLLKIKPKPTEEEKQEEAKEEKQTKTPPSKKIKNEMQPAKPAFIPPSFAEVENYILNNEYQVDPKLFYEKHQTYGWEVKRGGKMVPMKNWKLAVMTWHDNASKRQNNSDSNKPKPKTGLTFEL